jgi:hypothetical protein
MSALTHDLPQRGKMSMKALLESNDGVARGCQRQGVTHDDKISIKSRCNARELLLVRIKKKREVEQVMMVKKLTS